VVQSNLFGVEVIEMLRIRLSFSFPHMDLGLSFWRLGRFSFPIMGLDRDLSPSPLIRPI